MSGKSMKITPALVLLAAPTASFAQLAGGAGAGNAAISGVPRGDLPA
jgi:hypothetical protein